MGSLQSDDNFLAAHELEEDAISIDSRERDRRRGRSRDRVMPWLEDHQGEPLDDEDIIEEIGNGAKDTKTAGKQKSGEAWRGLKERKEKEKQVDSGMLGEPNVQKQLPPLPTEQLPVASLQLKQQRTLLSRLRQRGRE